MRTHNYSNKKVNITIEAPLELMLNGKKIATFMCTPRDLEDLATGHLYSRGIIHSVDELLSIGSCESGRRMFVILNGLPHKGKFAVPEVILTSCGSGSLFNEEALEDIDLKFDISVSIDEIREAFKSLMESAVLHNTLGGMHCAIITDFNKKAIREDIGRHNAVDKAIGAALKENINFEKSIIVTTGRISLDMILKAIGAKIPVIASLSIPSDLAIEIAERLGICIIGRIATKDPIIYTSIENIEIK